MSRIKEYPSITSFDGNNDALAIEQTDGASNRTRKVSPAQLKQYMEVGDFEATGEVKDGHGNMLKDISEITDLVAFKDITVSDPSGSLTEAQKVKAIVEGAIPSMNVSQHFVIANITYSNVYRGQILFSRVGNDVSYGCGIYTSYYADCNVYRFALRNGAVSVVKLADAT